MGLVLHQFRKDTRQFRWFLVVWLVLLGLDQLTNLGWVEAVHVDWTGKPVYSEFLLNAQLTFAWVLFLALPAVVVVADSPARREGFLSTRPLSKRDWLLAKILFITLAVILPAIGEEGIYLLLQGVSARYVLWGMGERALFVVPITLGMTAFASLWSNYARWVAGMAVSVLSTFGGFILLMFIVSHVATVPWLEPVRETSAVARLSGAVYLTLAWLAVLAFWHGRRPGGPWQRWSIAVSSVVIFGLSVGYWRWDFTAVQPRDPAAATALMNQAGFNVPLSLLQFSQDSQSPRDGKLAWNISLQTQDGLNASGATVRWVATNVVAVNAAQEQITKTGSAGRLPLFDPNYVPKRVYETRALASLLPANALILGRGQYEFLGMDNDNSVTLPTLKVPRTAPWRAGPITVRAGLAAEIFQWELAANLPAKTVATVADADTPGRWKAVPVEDLNKLNLVDRGIFSFHWLVEYDQVVLATAHDQQVNASAGMAANLEFLFYNPAKGIATRMYNQSDQISQRAGLTAQPKYYFSLNNLSPVPGPKLVPGELDQCRILIFRRTWLGTVPRAWQSPGLVLNQVLAPPVETSSVNQNGMSRMELNRRIAALPVPKPSANRPEVAAYLLDYIRLLEAAKPTLRLGDESSAPLLPLVPAHLDVFLDGLPAMFGQPKSMVLRAITLGAEEAQKPQIIGALAQDPELAAVVIQRGWLVEARSELYQLLDRPGSLPYPAVQALAWFADPVTYPRLIENLAANPSDATYDLMRTLPGIQPQLREAIGQQWTKMRGVADFRSDHFRYTLGQALYEGYPDAFREFWTALNELDGKDGSDDWWQSELLQNHVRLPANLTKPSHGTTTRLDPVLAWCRRHPADEFVFDSVRRQFVLKSELTGGQLALRHP